MCALIVAVSLKAWRKVLHPPPPPKNDAVVEKSVSLAGRQASGRLGFGDNSANEDEEWGGSINVSQRSLLVLLREH